MSLTTAPPDNDLIDDQARELRRLVAGRSSISELCSGQSVRRCRSLTVFSGKGGVGKSVLALNLACALAQQGAAVCLLDVTPNVGSLGLLCGQNGYWNLAHVLAGVRRLEDVVLTGPAGVRIIPGTVHLLNGTTAGSSVSRQLSQFEGDHDWLIVDTAIDVLHQARSVVEVADHALMITTPEPTSVAEAYSAMKTLSGRGEPAVSILVNQAEDERQARDILNRLRQAAKTFLASDAGMAGFVPFDDAVRQSVARREPLSALAPNCPAQAALTRIAERLAGSVTRHGNPGFFERLEEL